MKAVIIHNPAAGGARRKSRALDRGLDALASVGWLIDKRATGSSGDATSIAKDAVKENADVVVAAGGDGTVNEVIQALAHTAVALGVLPIGTVNVWAREAGFARDVEKAARQLATAETVDLDLGRAGTRYFLLMAGIGLDAEVASALGPAVKRKQQLRALPYVLRTARVIPRYRGASIDIELDGTHDTHDALMVLASNTRLYGGVARPSPGAVADDGMLDVRVFRGRGPAQSVGHIARLLLNAGGKETDTIRAKKMTVTATPPLAVQVDGDPIGTTPIEISVQPKALRVLIPRAGATGLISRRD